MYLYIFITALCCLSPCRGSELTSGNLNSIGTQIHQGLIPPTDQLGKNYRNFTYGPFTTSIYTTINSIAGKIPQGLVPIDRYNEYSQSYTETKISPHLIKEFLDQQVKSHCINPDTVTYLVGIEEQDWEYIKLSNGHGLVIPEYTPSISNLAYRLLKHTNEIEPTYRLNIKHLNDLLLSSMSEKNVSELAQYKLAIAKVIIKTASQNNTNFLKEICITGGMTHAVAFSARLSQGLSNALSALSYLYAYAPANDQWIKFQQNLDTYILQSADIDLLQAHIEDLEEQLAATKNSYTAKLLSYLPISQDQLEKRIEIIKEYAGSFEFKMLGRFCKK